MTSRHKDILNRPDFKRELGSSNTVFDRFNEAEENRVEKIKQAKARRKCITLAGGVYRPK